MIFVNAIRRDKFVSIFGCMEDQFSSLVDLVRGLLV